MAHLMSEDDRNLTRKPIGERWPPLGAPSSELAQEKSDETGKGSDSQQLKKLEEEHEQLNSSLLALTTHFAQVQFRLKQVVAAPKSEQEDLLQNLEKFAFEGIPDVDGAKPTTKHRKKTATKGYEKKLQDQKQKQEKLITQLIKQLEEMEAAVVKGASETTDSPQKLIEKQRLLLSQLSSQEKRRGSSWRRKDEINDKIPKEQVIEQITKQIIDLEKFIQLLQGETGMNLKKCSKCSNCSCEHEHDSKTSSHIAEKRKKKTNLQTALQKSPLLNARKTQPKPRADRDDRWNKNLGVNYTVDNFGIIEDSDSGNDVTCCILPKHAHMPGPPVPREEPQETGDSNQKIKEASLEIIKRALAILQIFAVSQFGCAGQHLQDQLIQKAMQTPVPPYENLIRGLRTSVENVLTQQAKVLEEIGIYPHGVNTGTMSRTSRSGSISSLVSTMSSIRDGSGEFTQTEAELIRTIRREFSNCLRDLLEHGLERNPEYSLISARSLVNCIMPGGPSAARSQNLHVWDLFMEFYRLKHGSEYNSAVPRKLSESFGIDVSGASAVTSKQTLLRTIHFVKSTHERCKRSKESMFRALVSAGLNQKKLSLWCRQIVKCGSLVDEFYQSWSCVVKTGFDEVLDLLERLTPLDFCLPEDLAIRHLTRANEAFGDNY